MDMSPNAASPRSTPPTPAPRVRAPAAPPAAVSLDLLLGRLVEVDGTDLYLAVGSRPMGSVKGELRPLAPDVLTVEAADALAGPLLAGERAASFIERPDLDLPYGLPGGRGRFRLNLYRQRGSIGLVARRIRADLPTIDGLGLPPVLRHMAMLKQGLVFVVGATGSGKSTTLAAMIDHRNATGSGHLVTVEDPIEFVHPHKRCVVSQREIGTDTQSYADGLRSALRQAPSVVLVGEVRDRDTAEAALYMAETGHLVLTTLHATNGAQAVERFANLFPPDARERVRLLLGVTLGGIVAQRLVRTVDGGRAAALEVLVPTARIRDLIAAGALDDVRQAMVESRGADGMQTFEDALARLVAEGRIGADEAIAHADGPADLRLRLRREAERSGRRVDLRESPEIRLL